MIIGGAPGIIIYNYIIIYIIIIIIYILLYKTRCQILIEWIILSLSLHTTFSKLTNITVYYLTNVFFC